VTVPVLNDTPGGLVVASFVFVLKGVTGPVFDTVLFGESWVPSL